MRILDGGFLFWFMQNPQMKTAIMDAVDGYKPPPQEIRVLKEGYPYGLVVLQEIGYQNRA